MTQPTIPPETTLPSPLNCLIGSAIAGMMSFASYTMTSNIATTFATKPMGHKTTMAVNIAAAVRTLVVGSTALGTAVFGIVAVGLFALGIQVAISGKQSQRKIG
jgi:zona occludens toxin (predicted ATPase)